MTRCSSWKKVSRGVAASIVAALSVACGGDKDDSGDSGGGAGSPVPNGSRLGWNQAAGSLQQAQSMQFRLYVDDAPMSLSAVSCAQGSSAGTHDCSGRLPTMSAGRHVLQLSSILDGMESTRSQPLAITISTSATTESTTTE